MTPIEQAKAFWEQMTDAEQIQFVCWINEQIAVGREPPRVSVPAGRQIDPAYARAYARQLFAQGLSVGQICRQMISQGIRPPEEAGLWNKQVVEAVDPGANAEADLGGQSNVTIT
jgi:hypothetical protein